MIIIIIMITIIIIIIVITSINNKYYYRIYIHTYTCMYIMYALIILTMCKTTNNNPELGDHEVQQPVQGVRLAWFREIYRL